MTTPPIGQGAVHAMDKMQLVLASELAPYLTAWGSSTGITLPVPASYWRGEIIPMDFGSPGVGLLVESTEYADYAAEGRWRALHRINMVVVLRDGNLTTLDRIDETRLDEAVQIMCQAMQQCVETYLPTAAYGGSVGIYDAQPAGSATAVIETDERDVYMRTAAVTMVVAQMIRGRIGAPP
jgi:uncharacterized protein YaaQ